MTRSWAELARAALLLDKDPTQARDLLASLKVCGPRHALEAAHARLMSVAGDELRVFALAKPRGSRVGHLPCQMFNLARSPDRTQALLDCDDGRARIWTLASSELREVHRHGDLAFGVAWLRDAACSAGLDGRVLCTAPGGETRTLLAQAGRIKWLEPSPDGAYLAAATDDGKLWKLAGDPQALYTQAAAPYRMAFTRDGQLLASGAVDGSVIVYDLARHEIQSSMKAHQGFVTSDRHLERIELSPDGRYVAATTVGEIAIIDLARRAVATLPMAGTRLDYAGFVSPELLAVAGTRGLYTVSLASLDYIAF